MTKLDRSTNSPKPEVIKSATYLAPPQAMQLNDKISLYKNDRKKPGAVSTLKKDELKQEIVDIGKYTGEVFKMKK